MGWENGPVSRPKLRSMSLPGMRLEPGPKRNERVPWWKLGYKNGHWISIA